MRRSSVQLQDSTADNGPRVTRTLLGIMKDEGCSFDTALKRGVTRLAFTIQEHNALRMAQWFPGIFADRMLGSVRVQIDKMGKTFEEAFEISLHANGLARVDRSGPLITKLRKFCREQILTCSPAARAAHR